MQQIKDYSDVRHRAWCIHCSSSLAGREVNRDHVPSKVLLEKPYPANLPVVTVCTSCNNGFAADEEYLAAFLGALLSGTTEPEGQVVQRAKTILARNAGLRERLERSKRNEFTAEGERGLSWMPEIDRIKRVVLKNARGHAFFETGEPMLDDPRSLVVVPFDHLNDAQQTVFEDVRCGVWPEVGSRLMTRLVSGKDLSSDVWIDVQDGVYRYAVMAQGGMTIRSVLFEYLATEVCW